MGSNLLWAAALAAVLTVPTGAVAADRCRTGPLDRAAVIECAVRNSPRVAADRAARKAVAGRRETARVALPAHPVVEVSAATRNASGIPRDWNLYGTIRQEIEVGGQRRRRIAAADAEAAVADARVRTTRRDAVVDGLQAYYDVLAARERKAVVDRATAVAAALATLAKARAEAGAAAGIAGDLADIAAVALRRRALEQARDEQAARARLARHLGLAPGDLPEVVGALEPLPVGDRDLDPRRRSEVAQADATVQLRDREIATARRARVPNPSLSFFVQRDGFAELVIGAGVALPLPLPGPVGPFSRGPVLEAGARHREAIATREAIVRDVQIETDVALTDLRARRDIAALYHEAVFERARTDLDALTSALEAGRMDLRDALIAQQLLLEFLEAAIEAHHGECLAALAAARALGVDVEELR